MVGNDVCFIDSVCYDKRDLYSYRASRRETFVSQCQVCNPASDATGWSVSPDFLLVADVEPPNDCLNITDSPTRSPIVAPTTSVISKTTDGGDENIATDEVVGIQSSDADSDFKLSLGTITGIVIGSISNMLLV